MRCPSPAVALYALCRHGLGLSDPCNVSVYPSRIPSRAKTAQP